MGGGYGVLDPQKVIETIGALQQRISERFAGAGLADVCGELLAIATKNSARARLIARRNVPLRLIICLLLAAGSAALAAILNLIYQFPGSAENVYTVLQGVDAAVNLLVLIGAGVFFLLRIEERMKRSRALDALHELRSIVHVIDMHQLTKDPSTMVSIAGNTPSSPARTLTRFEVARYLDYCSEMVALAAKVAVIFGQVFPDRAVMETVSDLERIASGLSQKIWQKIMILEMIGPPVAADPPRVGRSAAAPLFPVGGPDGGPDGGKAAPL
jgi:hypothetical protein